MLQQLFNELLTSEMLIAEWSNLQGEKKILIIKM